MPFNILSWNSRDDEMRLLRVHVAALKRALNIQKNTNQNIEEENKTLKKEIKNWEKKYQELEIEKNKLRREKDTYKSQLFKRNSKSRTDQKEKKDEAVFPYDIPKKKRGAQVGHKGTSRTKPDSIDQIKKAHLTNCPGCSRKLNRSNNFYTHTVTDIPPLELQKPVTTEYEIERQWCGNCQKEFVASPAGVIPHSRLGLNLVLYLMIQKYGAKSSLDSIIFLLKSSYGLTISKGTIIDILHRTKIWFGSFYETIIQLIQIADTKHADETGWRIEGLNFWVWAFLTKKEVVYTVEESRGKGVPHAFFCDSPPDSVLVRDDYAAYKKLKLKQQSCWAHLLRKSYEELNQSNASNEVKILHQKLKSLYKILEEAVESSFDIRQRNTIYDNCLAKIEEIVNASHSEDDTRRIQVRIKNQGKNLLTAILHKDVPLTNNLAERNIRPLVVTRKISGGSQSVDGAKTHMVNMSVFQTLKMRDQPFIPALKEKLLDGIFGKN